MLYSEKIEARGVIDEEKIEAHKALITTAIKKVFMKNPDESGSISGSFRYQDPENGIDRCYQIVWVLPAMDTKEELESGLTIEGFSQKDDTPDEFLVELNLPQSAAHVNQKTILETSNFTTAGLKRLTDELTKAAPIPNRNFGKKFDSLVSNPSVPPHWNNRL